MAGIDAILHRLTTLYPKAIEPGLSRTFRILGDLGNPHLNIPPVIHIAGTNGKGSTLAFIRAMLENAGHTCHVMTSPHLVKFNERIVVASREIPDDALFSLLQSVEEVNADKPITFFEITTAAGFKAFADTRADYTLLETGMGGRLDCTNVIDTPIVTIITNISWDHMQHLGNTLPDIAREKAGIIKPNVPCVIGPQTADALEAGVMQVFETRAKELNAPLYRHGHEWHFEKSAGGFTLYIGDKKFDCPHPALLGDHQIANAATAIIAMIAAGIPPNISSIKNAYWPARLQRISFPEFANAEIYLDGGHNEEGGHVLADQARAWAQTDDRKLHLIVGMLTTKDPAPFYAHLKPYIATATAIPIPGEKLAFTAENLSHTLNIASAPDLKSALISVFASDANPRILIAGSLYLAGHVLGLVNADR